MASEFVDFIALWPAKSGRGYRGNLDRRADPADIVEKLGAGWNILMFEQDNATGNQPTHRLVLAPPMQQGQARENTQGTIQRRDAPESHVTARDSRAAMDLQRPAARGRATPAQMGELDDQIPF